MINDDDDDDDDDCRANSGINEWRGKPMYSEKNCSSAAVCTSDPT
jgi:hypothetical protein